MKPYVSIVVPIYNESGNLEVLYERLTKVLDNLDKSYEIIFTDDGSKDNSLKKLVELYQRRPQQIRVIEFQKNFGQHMATMAGFAQARGEIIVTLDADLQNPPEEIPKLIAKMEEGYDLVSGYRSNRQDNWFRKYVSVVINYIRAKITRIKMVDHGCMLRAYRRNVIDAMVANQEATIFIPALAYSCATKPAEIEVAHAERLAGKSQYRLYSLIRLNFDLMTGYSLVPLQFFTFLGCSIAILSVLFFLYLLLRRIFLGPEVDGVFTLFAVLFFLIGVILMSLGIMGEYIGRIYQEVRHRPRFVIKKILGVDQ